MSPSQMLMPGLIGVEGGVPDKPIELQAANPGAPTELVCGKLPSADPVADHLRAELERGGDLRDREKFAFAFAYALLLRHRRVAATPGRN
jgi:hypothetical protein